jgi:predicted enzyme related to lactoylglutathione lyase
MTRVLANRFTDDCRTGDDSGVVLNDPWTITILKETPMEHGDFTHIELPADDTDRAKRFYTELFDWRFSETPGFDGYHMYATPGAGDAGVGGAIGKRGEMAPESMRTYIYVRSVDDVLARVPELGGRVIEEKQEVPGMGWFGVFTDSEGNELAVWESLPRG